MRTVAAREMRLASLLARPFRSAKQSGQRSPQFSPRNRRPQRTQGTSGSPLSDGTAELLRRGGPAQVAGADAVTDDGRNDGMADPLRPVQLAQMVEHHCGGEHLGRRVGDALPRDVRRAAVYRLKDG